MRCVIVLFSALLVAASASFTATASATASQANPPRRCSKNCMLTARSFWKHFGGKGALPAYQGPFLTGFEPLLSSWLRASTVALPLRPCRPAGAAAPRTGWTVCRSGRAGTMPGLSQAAAVWTTDAAIAALCAASIAVAGPRKVGERDDS